MKKTLPKIWRPFTIQGDNAPEPVKVESGRGVWLTLDDGRRVLDMISSWWVNLHGHSHPHIASEIAKQAQKLEHVIFAGYTHEPAEKLIDRLTQLTGGQFNHAFFSDNGSTAVEVAMKTAYQYWQNRGEPGRDRFIAFNDAYHGDTLGAMSAGAPSAFTDVFSKWLLSLDRVDYPAVWLDDMDAEQKEEKSINQIKSLLQEHPNSYAAIILEPLIQGAGGMRMCRPAFLRRLESLVKSYGVLIIYDEVMTGFGRTGSYFAWQEAQTQPDLICLSKGLTGGFLPMGLTMSTTEVFHEFYSDDALKTLWHGHSYTGNPLGCAAANASLDLLLESDKQRMMINRIHRIKLPELVNSIDVLVKPRICGTVAAVDLASNEQTGYFNPIGAQIKARTLDFGLLIRPLGNVLYFMPPYCISEEELSDAYSRLTALLHEIKKASL